MLVGVCKWLKCRNRRKKVVITAKRCVIWADFIVFCLCDSKWNLWRYKYPKRILQKSV
ncbi:hypothetical protein CMCT_0028 [Campylobacter mucosalis]|nr:hypothetical protein CMCT_0028 [Campylobacter mucosalis]